MTATEFFRLFYREPSIARTDLESPDAIVEHVTLEAIPDGDGVWYNCPPSHPGSGEYVAGLFTGWEGAA